jgi:hypothetical protein
MVLPLIPIAIAAGSGIGGTLLGSWFGKGKKEEKTTQITYAPQIQEAAPYQVYQPQVQYSPVQSYTYQGATYIVNSPYAKSKKEAQVTQTPEIEQAGKWYTPAAMTSTPETGMTTTSGTNLPLLLGIGVIGAIAVAYVGGKRK